MTGIVFTSSNPGPMMSHLLMTFLPAAMWNEVAKSQPLETSAAKVAFRLNPEQLAKMETIWMQLEREAGTPEQVMRCLPTCLPLLAETQALQSWISQNPQMMGALPEILSPQEAAILMQMEWRLTDAEKTRLQSALSSPDSLERWERAAQAASKRPSAPVLQA